jgi:hypothetical protein
MLTGNTQNGIAVTYDDETAKINFDVSDPTITISGDMSGEATIEDLQDTEIEITLATVNEDVGSFGSGTKIPTVTVDAKGRVTAVSETDVATTLGISVDDSNSNSIDLLTDNLSVVGGEGINTTFTDGSIVISGEDAAANNKGIASFDSTDFTVTGGNVVANSITLGSSTLNLGETTSSLEGLESLDVDNIGINGNEIASTNLNGDISLNPNGDGSVNVNSSRITNLGSPSESSDAATKAYVDGVAEGLHVHASVRAATDPAYGFSPSSPDTLLIDGVQLAIGDRLLVKDANTGVGTPPAAAPELNGIYVVTSVTPPAVARAADYDSPGEIDSGDFVFVTSGDLYGGTGWVQVNTIGTIGTDPVDFEQFSGAGTYLAGTNLDLDGNTFSLQDEITLSTVNADVVGNVSGNVTAGDMSFNTGGIYNSTVTVYNASTGAFVGNLAGNVTGSVDVNSGTIVNLSDPTNEQDAATKNYVDTELDSYLNSEEGTEGTTILYVQDYVDTAVATGDPTATPTYFALDINSVAKQVAVEYTLATSGVQDKIYSFPKADYRSAKFLVRSASGTHTEISEILLTLDTSDNVAITEYAVVGTNGSLVDLTATVNGSWVELQGTPANANTVVSVYGTLLA